MSEGLKRNHHFFKLPTACSLTYRDLGENVEEERDNGEVDVDPCPSKSLLQVLGHGDHLTYHRAHIMREFTEATTWRR